MKRTLLFAVCFAILFAVLIIADTPDTSEAQCSDFAGVPCTPTPQQDPNDTDGDGTPNGADACPEQGGPANNQGCPEGQGPSAATATPAPINLPIIPSEGECQLATLGAYNVNIRETPDFTANIAGQLFPTQLYPVGNYIITSPESETWYLVQGGWVFEGVVRINGDCSSLVGILERAPMVITGAEPDNGSGNDFPMREIIEDPFEGLDPLDAVYIQHCTEVSSFNIFQGQQDITQCDQDIYEYEGDEDIFECNGEIVADPNMPNDCNQREPQEIEEFVFTDGQGFVGLGFNIGVYPLGGEDNTPLPPIQNCYQPIRGGYEGVEIYGFNPQPEPPAPAYEKLCMMMANSNFGLNNNQLVMAVPTGDTNLVIPIPSDEGEGGSSMSQVSIIIIGNMPNPDALPSNLVTPPPDDGIEWYEMMYANGESMIIGEHEGSNYVCPSSLVGFNPQPEPPAPASTDEAINGIYVYGFNIHPPDPGEEADSGDNMFNAWDIVGFNPQPEPPAPDAVCINNSIPPDIIPPNI